MSSPVNGKGGKLSFATKFFFGSGDLFGGGAMVLVGFFFLFFMTEVAGLRPGLAGLVLLLGKGWDAVSDPLMGYISDRTRSRFGRRRLYFLAGIIPIVLTFTLLWTVPPLDTQMGLFLYFLIVSIMFNTVITMVMVPYNAIIPELTPNYDERSSLAGYRMAFSNIASLLGAALPLIIVNEFAEVTTGWQIMGLSFGLLFALPFIGVFAFTAERHKVTVSKGFTLFKDMMDTLANRSFRVLIGVYLVTFLTIDVISAVLIYYLTYAVGIADENFASMILGLLLLSQTLALGIYVPLAKKYGKKVSFMAGAILWIVLIPFLFLVTPETPLAVVIILAVFIGAGTSGAGFSPWAMYPDVLDVDEMVTGERRQGIYSGVMTFLRKISSAVALAVVGLALELSGYVEAREVQPESFVLAVKLLVAFLPVLLVLIAIFLVRRYPLTSERHALVQQELARRTEGTELPPVSSEAAQIIPEIYGPVSGSPHQGRGTNAKV